MAESGNNVEWSLKGEILTITCKITKELIKKAPKSSSGKTNMVATTSGFVRVGTMHGHKIGLAVNVTAKPEA